MRGVTGSTTTYPEKVCTICGHSWQPKNRYQWTRNQMCSPACNGVRISRARRGAPSPLNRKVTVACAVCGTPVSLSPSHHRRVAKPTCSRQCNGKLRAEVVVLYSDNGKGKSRPGRYGEDNPAWKGGITLKRPKGNYRGVRYVRAPQWALPMARSDGYIAEHRLVMARMCGRLLDRTEVVDHIDHNPANNDPGNLRLWPDNGSHKRGEVGRIFDGTCNRWLPRHLDVLLGESSGELVPFPEAAPGNGYVLQRDAAAATD